MGGSRVVCARQAPSGPRLRETNAEAPGESHVGTVPFPSAERGLSPSFAELPGRRGLPTLRGGLLGRHPVSTLPLGRVAARLRAAG